MATIGSTTVEYNGRLGLEDVGTARWKGIAAPFDRKPKGYFDAKPTRETLWSSILNILLTPLGTRIMLPEFGSRLTELVFEPNDEMLEDIAKAYIADALVRWEPRVRVARVDIYRDGFNENALIVSIDYAIGSEEEVLNNQFVMSQGGSLGAAGI